mmetsp:Transcript_31051/g.46854  ORF Transcript_31051/g.46854 Transcript_31051/m.46854 type:complete len:202 (-) Transcript_31051:927-1532(-)
MLHVHLGRKMVRFDHCFQLARISTNGAEARTHQHSPCSIHSFHKAAHTNGLLGLPRAAVKHSVGLHKAPALRSCRHRHGWGLVQLGLHVLEGGAAPVGSLWMSLRIGNCGVDTSCVLRHETSIGCDHAECGGRSANVLHHGGDGVHHVVCTWASMKRKTACDGQLAGISSNNWADSELTHTHFYCNGEAAVEVELRDAADV